MHASKLLWLMLVAAPPFVPGPVLLARSQDIGPAVHGNGGLSSLMGAGGDQEGMLRALSAGPNGRARPESKPELRHPVALLTIDGGARFLVSSFMSDQVLVGDVPQTTGSRTMPGNHPELRMQVFAGGVYCLQRENDSERLLASRQNRSKRRTVIPVTRTHHVGIGSKAPASRGTTIRERRSGLRESVIVRASAVVSRPLFWQDITRSASGCAVLNSPWGLARWDGAVLVASFGSDQVLVFDEASGSFLGHLGDSTSLDSPEGLAVGMAELPARSGGIGRERPVLFVANFVSGSISRFDLETGRFAGFLVPSTPPRALAGPEGLALVRHGPLRGVLLAVSHWSNSVEAFDSGTGQHLGSAMRGPAREGDDAEEATTVILGIHAASAGRGTGAAAEGTAADAVEAAAKATLADKELLRAAWNASLFALGDTAERSEAEGRAAVRRQRLLRGPVGICLSDEGDGAVRVLVTAYQTGKLLQAKLRPDGEGRIHSSGPFPAWSGTVRGMAAAAMVGEGGAVIVASYDSHTIAVLNASSTVTQPSSSGW